MVSLLRGMSRVEYARNYPMPRSVTALRFINALLTRTVFVCIALSLILLVFSLALEEDVFPLDTAVKQGWDKFFRMAIGVLALGGIFGLLVINSVVHDALIRRIRRVLNGFAEDNANLNSIPVHWQRKAIAKTSVSPHLGVLGLFGLILGPLILITGIWMLFKGDDLVIESILIGTVLTGLGCWGVMGFRGATGPALERWGHRLPKLHPREPKRTYDSDGDLEPTSRGELTGTPEAKQELRQAPERLRRFAKLDGIANLLCNISIAVFVLSAIAVGLGVVIRQPCQDCKPRSYGEAGESFIDGLLIVGIWTVSVAMVILIASVVVYAIGHLLLRKEVAELAAQPTSRRPPWFILRAFILEEAPLESLMQHLHTVGISSIGVGLSGILTSGYYPFAQWQAFFQMLITLGFSLLALYTASWFWNRGSTVQQAELLRDRWED